MTPTSRLVSRSAVALLPWFAAALPAQRPPIALPRVDSFRPLSSYNVAGGNAEIVDATPDGRTLVYTDAGARRLGIVDLTDPAAPTEITTLAVAGEPTSVSIAGRYAFAAVWTDLPVPGQPAPAFGPSQLVVIDLLDPRQPVVVGHAPIGYHPDSCKARRIGDDYYVVVAIENQPVVVQNGVVTSEERPGSPNDQSPAGLVQVVRVDVADPAASTVVDVPLPAAQLAAAGCLYPNDPQPEFVAWQGTQAVVTLQENNGVARLDLTDPAQPVLAAVFSTGVVAPRAADLRNDRRIDFAQVYPTDAPTTVRDAAGQPVVRGARMADAIAFAPDGNTLFTADEGEFNFTGGRGFSIWSPSGAFLGDDGGSLEQTAVAFSHYPDGRSAARGIEVEGLATGRFGGRDFLFAMSERGSFLAVYALGNPAQPTLLQILPTGLSPEGIVVIPQRNLVVTADELSGTLSIFQGQPGPYRPSAKQPQLYSADLQTPWAALSGLCAGDGPHDFFAVPDNAMPTTIFALRTGQGFAPVRAALPVRRAGVPATYDGEGLCRDHSVVAPANAGFWIAHEGNGTTIPNLLVQVDGQGEVVREIQLPNGIDAGADAALGGAGRGPLGGQRIGSNGFEGVALSPDGRFLHAAIQREFAGEFATGTKYARIARYDLEQVRNQTAPELGLRTGGDWEFFYFAFDTNDPVNWPGLSELTAVDQDRFLVIERDKGVGAGSTLKRVYGFSLAGLTPDTDGVPDASDTVRKVLVRDVVAAFSPYEKIEGLGLGTNGHLWVLMDNDGGQLESRLVDCGPLRF